MSRAYAVPFMAGSQCAAEFRNGGGRNEVYRHRPGAVFASEAAARADIDQRQLRARDRLRPVLCEVEILGPPSVMPPARVPTVPFRVVRIVGGAS